MYNTYILTTLTGWNECPCVFCPGIFVWYLLKNYLDELDKLFLIIPNSLSACACSQTRALYEGDVMIGLEF